MSAIYGAVIDEDTKIQLALGPDASWHMRSASRRHRIYFGVRFDKGWSPWSSWRKVAEAVKTQGDNRIRVGNVTAYIIPERRARVGSGGKRSQTRELRSSAIPASCRNRVEAPEQLRPA